MSKSITRPKLEDVVADAATSGLARPAVTVGKAPAKAREVAAEVVTDGRIALPLICSAEP